MLHSQNIDVEIEGIPEEIILFTEVNVNKKGKDFSGNWENPPSYAYYEVKVNMDDLEWDTSEYTDEQNKLISEFAEKNKKLLEKKFEKHFKLENPKWESDEYVFDFDDDFDEDDLPENYRRKRYRYGKGGKVKKLYAILVSPMGEMIADVEVQNQDSEQTAFAYHDRLEF